MGQKKPGADMRRAISLSLSRHSRDQTVWLLREDLEQIFQIFLAAGIVQERLQAENFLHGAQRGSMRVVLCIPIAVALGEGREYDHADGTIPAVGFVPGNEDRAAMLVGGRFEDGGKILCEPCVAVRDGISVAAVVHVITDIRCYEVVARHLVRL